MSLILSCQNISKQYGVTKSNQGLALSRVSFNVQKGEILGIVGESGSGKTTLAKIICDLEEATAGKLKWSVPHESSAAHPAQMVFQNPFNSLNPKLKIAYILKEALAAGKRSKISDVSANDLNILLENVGLENIDPEKYPHQLSGGQKQRVGIARSLAIRPKLLVCDEVVSALDISVQAQILGLLIDINLHTDITIIFISHDIAVVSMLADNILVMKSGKIVERGNRDKLFLTPESNYTRELFSAIPKNPWQK